MRRFFVQFLLFFLVASLWHFGPFVYLARAEESAKPVETNEELYSTLAPPIAPRRDDGLDELPEEVFVATDPREDPSHPMNWGTRSNKKRTSAQKSHKKRASQKIAGKQKGGKELKKQIVANTKKVAKNKRASGARPKPRQPASRSTETQEGSVKSKASKKMTRKARRTKARNE